jgi:hypothetical protein
MWIADPLDNLVARRELRKGVEYMESLFSEDDWVTAKRIFESPDIIARLLEAGR